MYSTPVLKDDFVRAVSFAIQKAESNTHSLSQDILVMEGMTGRKTRIFYNELLKYLLDPRYLEIGTWMGSSLCSAIFNNNIKQITVIDNWSEFGKTRSEFENNLQRLCPNNNNISIIEGDSFHSNIIEEAKNKGPYNVYLYDGLHTPGAHERALTHYIDMMDDVFIFIIDDWNWEAVRVGTKMAFMKTGVEILHNVQIGTPYNGHSEWWNGMGVFVLKKVIII